MDGESQLVIRAFRACKNPKKFTASPRASPKLLIRKGSLIRTKKSRNIRASLGRSQKTNDLHSLFRKESIDIASIEEQKEVIQEIIKQDIRKHGDEYFFIESNWWSQWKQYVGIDSTQQEGEEEVAKPDPIDNSVLLEEGQDLTSNFLKLKVDILQSEYQLVSKSVWKKILAWYGGGPTISRKVVISGIVTQNLRVELFPFQVRIMKIETEEIKVFHFSPTSTIKEIRRVIASRWAAPLLKCRIFLYKRELTVEETISKTLQELEIPDNQILLLKTTDSHTYALSGKIMGLTNLQEKPPTLTEKHLSKSAIDLGKKAEIKEMKKEIIVYIPRKKAGIEKLEKSEKAKLKDIATEICKMEAILESTPRVSAC